MLSVFSSSARILWRGWASFYVCEERSRLPTFSLVEGTVVALGAEPKKASVRFKTRNQRIFDILKNQKIHTRNQVSYIWILRIFGKGFPSMSIFYSGSVLHLLIQIVVAVHHKPFTHQLVKGIFTKRNVWAHPHSLSPPCGGRQNHHCKPFGCKHGFGRDSHRGVCLASFLKTFRDNLKKMFRLHFPLPPMCHFERNRSILF